MASKTAGRTKEKRTLLTTDEEREIDELLGEIRHVLDIRVNYSELCRVALTLVLQHEKKFLAELKKAKKDLRKPQTVDLQGTFDFEFQLADLLQKAVRRRK